MHLVGGCVLSIIHPSLCFVYTYVYAGMEFESGPGSDSYDYQFVKWLAKEKVNAVCVRMWRMLHIAVAHMLVEITTQTTCSCLITLTLTPHLSKYPPMHRV